MVEQRERSGICSRMGDRGIRAAMQDMLRRPYHLHEWYMVSNADVLRGWGMSVDDLAAMQQAIEEVHGTGGPRGVWRHGGRDSSGGWFHSQIDRMVHSSSSLAEFQTRVQNWADTHLAGGADALPDLLRPASGAVD